MHLRPHDCTQCSDWCLRTGPAVEFSWPQHSSSNRKRSSQYISVCNSLGYFCCAAPALLSSGNTGKGKQNTKRTFVLHSILFILPAYVLKVSYVVDMALASVTQCLGDTIVV
jgi:hypothetical protein